jgi:hypothetical protein
MTARPRRSQPSASPDDPILTQHQAFIRSLPCLACGKPAPSECATLGRLARLAVRERHQYRVPLCGPPTVWQDCCHSRRHYLGASRFWSELEIDPFDLALQLWRVSGDVLAGMGAVTRTRQAAVASRQRLNLPEVKASSPRSALNRSLALRDRWRPTVIVTTVSRSGSPLLLESQP